MDENFGIIKINADYDFDVNFGDIFYCKCPFCEDENIVSLEYLNPICVCEHFSGFDPHDRTFLFIANADTDDLDENIILDEEDFDDLSSF